MKYTKEQIIDAFCAATHYRGKDVKQDKKAWRKDWIKERKEQIAKQANIMALHYLEGQAMQSLEKEVSEMDLE